MKQFCLFFIVVFLGSCVSESVNKDNAAQTIIVMTNHGELIPYVNFKIDTQKNETAVLKSDDNGTLIFNAINQKKYNVELEIDWDLFYDNKTEIKEFHEVYTDNETKKFIVIHLKHKNDTEIVTQVDKGSYTYVTVEHAGCYDDGSYYLELESRKNYILIHHTRPMYNISM
jgi:hypothetical protein